MCSSLVSYSLCVRLGTDEYFIRVFPALTVGVAVQDLLDQVGFCGDLRELAIFRSYPGGKYLGHNGAVLDTDAFLRPDGQVGYPVRLPLRMLFSAFRSQLFFPVFLLFIPLAALD